MVLDLFDRTSSFDLFYTLDPPLPYGDGMDAATAAHPSANPAVTVGAVLVLLGSLDGVLVLSRRRARQTPGPERSTAHVRVVW